MKIGVIGLGNIFQKAYLPILSSNRSEHTFYFASQNEKTKEKIKEAYGFDHFFNSLEELLEIGVEACMIHSATGAHYELAKKCLESGIHVFIDKPLSENYEETRELIELAEKNNLILMLGFNRRFAPGVESIKELSNKRVITLEKNRIFEEYSPEFVVYDLLLHLIDTAVYLVDSSDVKLVSSTLKGGDVLEYATVQLEADDTTVFISMDMKSGANTEMYRGTSKEGIVTVTNLVNVTHQKEGTVTQLPQSDWATTLYKRGFDSMVTEFFEALETGNRRQLKQEHVLLSHEICQQILKA